MLFEYGVPEIDHVCSNPMRRLAFLMLEGFWHRPNFDNIYIIVLRATSSENRKVNMRAWPN